MAKYTRSVLVNGVLLSVTVVDALSFKPPTLPACVSRIDCVVIFCSGTMWRHWTDAAGGLRSWISELSWNASKTATIAAVATGTGLAAVYLCWKTDSTFQNWARDLTMIGTSFDSRMADRKLRLFGELDSLKDARGDGRLVLLEIGCGSGHNFKYYPDGSEVICVEPNRHFESVLRESADQHQGVRISAYHISSAENLRDVQSGSVDAVVSTEVLCSVSDPDRCLREIVRVLKPGGKCFVVEHVKAPPEFYVVRTVQMLLDVCWPLIYYGCRLSRRTQDNIRRAGFSGVDLEEFEAYELMRPPRWWGIRLVRSHIIGTATK